jgi:uncharacterized protein (TIGR03435 family)
MKSAVLTLIAAGLYAQSPHFEVATLKALPPGSRMLQRTSDGAQLHYPGVSLLQLLREAWRLKRPEQIDGPAWMRTQVYSVQAKLPEGAPRDQIPEMLQALLADELKLAVHLETRPMPSNVLLAGKKGSKMSAVSDIGDGLTLSPEVPPLVHLAGRGSMADLIEQLNHGLGGANPWVDETGLSGLFEIRLAFDQSPDSPLAKQEEIATLPKLRQALEEQLGLRVEVRKLPTEILVVDHVEKK